MPDQPTDEPSEVRVLKGPVQVPGAQTGRTYDLGKGESVTEPEPGEFDHAPPSRIVTRPADPSDDLFGQAYSPSQASVPDRSFTGDGSWKTLYENGEQVGKVQCSAEEAQAWTEGDLSISDLK